jgi:predicted DNA-binding transcriptional regulator AlpA
MRAQFSNVEIDDPFVDSKYVAALLQVHLLTVYRYLRENKEFPVPIKLTANRLAWPKSQIDKYVADRPLRVQSTLAKPAQRKRKGR